MTGQKRMSKEQRAMMIADLPYLTNPELQEKYQISNRSVRRWREITKIPAYNYRGRKPDPTEEQKKRIIQMRKPVSVNRNKTTSQSTSLRKTAGQRCMERSTPSNFFRKTEHVTKNSNVGNRPKPRRYIAPANCSNNKKTE